MGWVAHGLSARFMFVESQVQILTGSDKFCPDKMFLTQSPLAVWIIFSNGSL